MARRYGFDILRIASMGAVVLIHTCAQYWARMDANSFDWAVLNFYDSFARWAVPVFVMISGALFLDPCRQQPLKKLYAKNIARIVVVILVWGLAYALLYNPPEDMTLRGLWAFAKAWVTGHFHMWFLFMILGLYVVTPVLRCVTRDEMAMRYFLCVALVVNVLLPFATSFGRFSILSDLLSSAQLQVVTGYCFYYVLGYWISRRDLTPAARKGCLVVFVCGVAATFALTQYVSVEAGHPLETFYGYFALPVFVASAALFAAAKSVELRSDRCRRIVDALSSASLGVYLVHIIVLDALASAGIDSMMLNPLFAVPLTAATVTILSFMISYALGKIPLVGKYCV